MSKSSGVCVLLIAFVQATWLLHSGTVEADDKVAQPVRMACVGDSITYGHGLPNRVQECYPTKLAAKLGKGFEVRNFGVSGATLLSKGTRPYVDQAAYRDALAFKPQVLVIMLGTNDTNQQTWPSHKSEFVSDYLKLITAFRDVDKNVKVWICLPPPLFRDRGKARDTDAILRDEVIPKIKEVSRKSHVDLIDLNSELAESSRLLPDGVHPNAEGADVMARAVHKVLTTETTTNPADKP